MFRYKGDQNQKTKKGVRKEKKRKEEQNWE